VVAHQPSAGAPLQRECSQSGLYESPAGHPSSANIPCQLDGHQHKGRRSDCHPETPEKEHGRILGILPENFFNMRKTLAPRKKTRF